jgi:hypothetical protein
VFESRKRSLQKKTQRPSTPSIAVLSEEDTKVLNTNQPLTDVHVGCAMSLLKKQFPNFGGLEDPVLGSKLQFSVSKGQFVQVVHTGNHHWITLSNVDGLPGDNCVTIYNSGSFQLTMEVKMQIAALMHCKKPSIKVEIAPVQHQQGGSDCGLFAIAFATSLCYGNNPSHLHFTQCLLQRHFLQCIRDQKLTEFPSVKPMSPYKRLKSVQFSVHCMCRLPDNHTERMVECTDCRIWVHQSCAKLSTTEIEKLKTVPWRCPECQR